MPGNEELEEMKLETEVVVEEKGLPMVGLEELSDNQNTEEITNKEPSKTEFNFESDMGGEQALLESIEPLSRKWSTGAGPRIGCLREYPSDLQCKALEQVHLSPTIPTWSTTPIPSPRPSPRVRISPQLAQMCSRAPTISLALPKLKKKT